MSRHHILPPIVYTPAPRPKKVESRKTGRIQKRDPTSVTDSSDIEDTDEAIVVGHAGTTRVDTARDRLSPIDHDGGQTQQAPGKLSESTLKIMLQAQEIDNAPLAKPSLIPPKS